MATNLCNPKSLYGEFYRKTREIPRYSRYGQVPLIDRQRGFAVVISDATETGVDVFQARVPECWGTGPQFTAQMSAQSHVLVRDRCRDLLDGIPDAVLEQIEKVLASVRVARMEAETAAPTSIALSPRAVACVNSILQARVSDSALFTEFDEDSL